MSVATVLRICLAKPWRFVLDELMSWLILKGFGVISSSNIHHTHLHDPFTREVGKCHLVRHWHICSLLWLAELSLDISIKALSVSPIFPVWFTKNLDDWCILINLNFFRSGFTLFKISGLSSLRDAWCSRSNNWRIFSIPQNVLELGRFFTATVCCLISFYEVQFMTALWMWCGLIRSLTCY